MVDHRTVRIALKTFHYSFQGLKVNLWNMDENTRFFDPLERINVPTQAGNSSLGIFFANSLSIESYNVIIFKIKQ